MPAANGHELSSQSHLLEVVGTRQPAAACCLLPAWTWTTTTKISVCATSTPPHHHTTTDLPAGQGTDKQEPPLSQAYLATQRPSAIHSQAARRASPRSRFRTGAPVFVCFASSKDHPSDGQTYRCPKPTIGSCSDFAASPHLIPPLSNTRLLTLGFPKVPSSVPTTVFSRRTRIDETRHQPAVTVSGGQTKTNTNLHLHSRQ